MHFVPLTNLPLMSSSIVPRTASAMRPQTTACCFCCLSAFNGLAFRLACLSECVPDACGYPSITSLRFEWQDVKRRQRDFETMSDGVEKNGSKYRDKRQEREGLKGRVIIKMLVYIRPAESCLCPRAMDLLLP